MINPYLDQTIADQFQAEADLSEFDPLDIAVLGNVASKKKNDIGINKLKQDAAFGLTPMQSVFKLYNEKRQAEEELAQREAETDRYGNQAKIIDSEVAQMVGPTDQELRQRGLYGFQNATPIMGNISKQGFMGAVGQPDATSPYRDLSAPQASVGASPYELSQPGTMPMTPAPVNPLDLATRYGVLGEEKANLQREYASDAGYNQAMAAVREALGKAPNVPTMAKPQLTQEDQALIALAGIFGGFQNMPQALQGALAGAQQRAEIQNQQIQNKFQQEQAVYGRQLQGLQNIAATEEERRQQEQKTLDRIYSTKLGKIEGEMAKIPYQQVLAKQGERRLGIQEEGLELQKTKEEKRAATLRNQITKKEQVDALNREIKSYNEKLSFLANREKITEKDVKDMLNFRMRAIQRLTQQGLSVPQDYFFIPPSGMNPRQVMAQANKVFNEGVDLAIDAATGKFPVIPLDPEIDKKFKTYQSEVDKMNKQNLEITRRNTERDIRIRKLQSEASNLQTPGGTTFMGIYKQPSVKQEDKKRFDELMKEIENTRKAKGESERLFKENLKYIKQYEDKMNEMAGLEPVLPPADQGMKGAVSKTPGKKTSQNTFETSLGTLTFNA